MITTNDITDLNGELLKIWSSYKGKIKKKDGKVVSPFLSPCYLSDTLVTNECKLLIIGLNPSYSYPNWKKVLKKEIPPEQAITQKLKDLREEILDHSIGADKKNASINNYCTFREDEINKYDLNYLDSSAADKNDGVQYFAKMHELATKTLDLNQDKWRHIDIFYYRVTNQNTVKELMKHNEQFFAAQRNITFKIIKLLKPSAILVTNAFAGSNFRRMFSHDDESFMNQYPIDELKGTHIMKIGEEEDVPVFFSGMLSGQRALDLGSYERLKWHMKAVADGKSMR